MNNTIKTQWQKSFEEAQQSIENYLLPKPQDSITKSEFRTFANWLMDNPHSAYEYMPSGFQEFKSNPFEFASVLSIVNHALCDDGEISFVTMKLENEPINMFILFMWKNEDGFKEICEKENKDSIDLLIKNRQISYNILSDNTSQSDKTRSIKPLITKDDFTFEAHSNPLQFIEEFENFQALKNENHTNVEKRKNELLKNFLK